MGSSRPLICIRTDASLLIGTGHVVRCLSLARALRLKGAEVHFLTRLHSGHLAEWITKDCFSLTPLACPKEPYADTDAYASWRSLSEQDDANECVAALRGRRPDWLIVDHYGLGIEWESILRPHVHRIMAIDDLPDRAHDCDLFLDQNYGSRPRPLSEPAIQLLGPDYSLLSPVFSAHRACLRERSEKPERILLYFGGVDSENFAGKSLEVLNDPVFSHLNVDLVAGARCPHLAHLQKLCEQRENTTLHKPMPDLARLMHDADFAIGAGGATTWERCCLGLPSVVVAIAENQESFSEALARDGYIRYLGKTKEWTPSGLKEALLDLIESPAQLKDLSKRCARLVDGLGVDRIAESLLPSAPETLQLLPCKERAQTEAGMAASHFVMQAGNLPLLRASCIFHPTFLELRIEDEPTTGRQDLRELLVRKLYQQLSKGVTGLVASGLYGTDPRALLPLQMQAVQAVQRPASIAILSDESSWMNQEIPSFILELLDQGHRVQWKHKHQHVQSADLCLYLSYGKIVPPEFLKLFKNNLVVHGSALPAGKGWSPVTWQVLEGCTQIPMTLLEAEAALDSGAIYDQVHMKLDGHELMDEIRSLQASATFDLCSRFIAHYPDSAKQGRPQQGVESIYPKRRPADSRLAPDKSITEQFHLFRVVDNEAYPAYFDWMGQRYLVKVTKASKPAS